MESDKRAFLGSNVDTELASNVDLTKKRLRRLMKDKFLQTDESELADWSGRIVQRLKDMPGWVNEGQSVAVFGGLKSEPDIRGLLTWLWSMNCQTVFFGIEETGLAPWRVESESGLRSGQLGAFEPATDSGIQALVEDIDVVLTPGLAFDPRQGSRMGRGKGYYDRLFAQPVFRAKKIGICFEMQCVEGIPMAPHDVCVDALMTESRWVDFQSA